MTSDEDRGINNQNFLLFAQGGVVATVRSDDRFDGSHGVTQKTGKRQTNSVSNFMDVSTDDEFEPQRVMNPISRANHTLKESLDAMEKVNN